MANHRQQVQRDPVEAIEIVAYSPEWPVLFEDSKQLIAQALPGGALNIEHVGSTAVPKLAAKPIIDMDLIVDDPTGEKTYVPALAVLGYVLTLRERTSYEHRMLRQVAAKNVQVATRPVMKDMTGVLGAHLQGMRPYAKDLVTRRRNSEVGKQRLISQAVRPFREEPSSNPEPLWLLQR